MMPRFVKLIAPSSINSKDDVILMKAHDDDEKSAKYVTSCLDGYFILNDSESASFVTPTEEEINGFACDAIETYRNTESARNLAAAIRAVCHD